MRHALKSAGLILTVALSGCRHEADPFAVDAELLDRARGSEASVWYRFDDDLLPRSSGSGHNEAFLRTRFNDVAASILDENGKVMEDTLFPNGSLIVKELWLDENTLGTYAVLLKRAGTQGADADGWVWGYVRANGEVRESAINAGNACRSCHGQTGHIDRTLMNAYFP